MSLYYLVWGCGLVDSGGIIGKMGIGKLLGESGWGGGVENCG